MLDKDIEKLKVAYEQYFMGISRVAPGPAHAACERMFRDFARANIRKTSVRFRVNALKQKFASYNTYWRRILRQIEKGTYVRDMARVQRRAIETGQDVPDEVLAKMPKRMRDELLKRRESSQADSTKRKSRKRTHAVDADLFGDLDLDNAFDSILSEAAAAVDKPSIDTTGLGDDLDSAFGSLLDEPEPKPARKAPKPISTRKESAAQNKRAPSVPPGMTESQTRQLYQKFVQARKSVGASNPLSYEQMVKSLNSSAPKVMSKYGTKSVDFEVVIKNNKAVLQAKRDKEKS